jgi:hypothetical protein
VGGLVKVERQASSVKRQASAPASVSQSQSLKIALGYSRCVLHIGRERSVGR